MQKTFIFFTLSVYIRQKLVISQRNTHMNTTKSNLFCELAYRWSFVLYDIISYRHFKELLIIINMSMILPWVRQMQPHLAAQVNEVTPSTEDARL